MARDGFPTITVDDRAALARLSRLTEDVRGALRTALPAIGLDLQAKVRAKLVPGVLFKSSTNLRVDAKLVENSRQISTQVTTVWTGDPDRSMVPAVLESGARPHVIEAKRAKALYFFWERLGMNVAFKRVNHPGFPGRSYMESTFDENRDAYTEQLRVALAAVVSS